ncbi:hypothetical protein TWF703_002511 [Orbilia oligospora]|uniref:Zeta toxin domain-containing protein n=1 Tax=Orbilia oligospora TaxID=2813651 RepID=A0A7C8JYU9_ORBOL|nr:hypothetical protein TWF703_002511 [Orbilia oligospora]
MCRGRNKKRHTTGKTDKTVYNKLKKMSTQQTAQKIFIQMSGAPGSGKSTMARMLGESIGAVVIDHDIIRSSLLEANVPFDQAAKQAYQLQWALAQDIMKQGHSTIVDSTCNFEEVLERGSALAQQYGFVYWYVECKVQDIDLLDQRLCNRNALTSQRTGVDRPPAAAHDARAGEDSHALFQKWIENPCRPLDNAIIVDSTGDMEMLRDFILNRIIDRQGN